MTLKVKVSAARPMLVKGRRYRINPYPQHLQEDFFAEAVYVGPPDSMPGREHIPPMWHDIFDFSGEKGKAFNRILDGFYTAIPGWRDLHSKKRLMPVDGNGIVEIDEKDMCY